MNDGDSPKPAKMTLQATVAQAKNAGPFQPPPTKDEPKKVSWSDRVAFPGRLAILLAILLSPWAFGSYNFWPQFGIASALLFALGVWWFETAMTERKSQVFPYLFFPVCAGLLLGLLQLWGLPEWLANVLLGRQSQIYSDMLGIEGYRPSISLSHEGTWHQVRLLLIGISGLLLGCRYFRSKRDLNLFLITMTLNGVIISFFGLIQKFSSNGKIYWYHELNQGGQFFGPFVNRNNASGYLLICLSCAMGLLPILMSVRKRKGPELLISKEMPFWRQYQYFLLDFVAELTASKVAILMAIGLIFSAIAATLSRGGVVALLFASIATILAYGMARRPKNSSFAFVPVALLVAGLGVWLAFGEDLTKRFDSIDAANFSDTDIRMQHWQSTWPAVWDHGLFGAGLGSYEDVHRLYRNDSESILFHYAENQYFQSVIEAGWVGLCLFLLAWLFAFKYASFSLNNGNSPTTIGVGTMGMFLFFSQGLAAAMDFSFYIPANLLALSVCFGFVAYHAQALAGRLKERSWLHLQAPKFVIQAVVVLLFFSMVFVAIDLYSRSGVQLRSRPLESTFTSTSPDLETTDQKLSELMPLVQAKPTSEGLNYAAALRIHRSRLLLLADMKASPDYKSSILFMTDPQREKYEKSLWELTNLQFMHENKYSLSQESKFGASSFINQPAIKENLPLAHQLLTYSCRMRPLQARVHLRLGQIKAVLKNPGDGDLDIERAIKLAPANIDFRKLATAYYLQSDDPQAAAPHVKRILELQPHEFKRTLKLLLGRANRSTAPVDPKLIVESMLPDSPKMLYELASQHYPQGSPEQTALLDRIAKLIEDAKVRDPDDLLLLGNIYFERKEYKSAITHYTSGLLSNPKDRPSRLHRAEAHFALGNLDDALLDVKTLREQGDNSIAVRNLLAKIENAIAQRSIIERQGKSGRD